MRLQNTAKAMAGSQVMVNGTIYKIDKDGFCDVQNEADAKKLLLASYWRVAGAAPAVAPKPEPMKLLTTEGPVEPGKPSEPPTPVDPVSLTALTAPEVPAEGPAADPPIPTKGQAWPDPLPTYSMDWLTKCAKAYKVKLPKKVTKKQLCELIVEEMYEDK